MTTPLTRILVIEDDPAHSEAIARSLEREARYEVRQVSSLRAFRAEAAAFQPQLVLMDLNLPDGRATEALADPGGLRPFPIIVMTSYGSEAAAVEVMKAGAHDYLVKSPESFTLLPRTLEQQHREWQLGREALQAEAALRETHRFNDQIIRCAQEGIIVYGADLRYQVWNPFMERLTGIREAQVLGRHPLEFFPFLADSGVVARLERVLAGEPVASVEFPFSVPGTGATGWATDTSAPLYNAAGEIIGAIGTVHDITEKKQREATQLFLARAEWLASGTDIFSALAAFLAGHLGMDYVCIDRLAGDLLAARTLAIWFDGRFEDNVEYTLLDTPCGEVVGKRICCFPEGVRHRFPKDQVLQEMVAESYLGTTLFGADGRPIGLIAMIGRGPIPNPRAAEATLALVAERAAGELERRQAEEETRQREAQFRTYIDKAPFGVFIADQQGRYLEVNPAASRMTGFSREELLSLSIPDLLAQTSQEEGIRSFQTLLANGYVFTELDYLHKDGQQGRWSVEAVGLSPNRFLGFTQDLTARRQGELERAKLEQHLQQVQKLESLGSLAGGVAHDMNNVLGAILSLASAHLTLQPADSPVHKAFATIVEAATRGGKMVRSLLTFARQQPAEERVLDLNALLAQVLSLLEPTTRTKVHLVTVFAGDLEPVRGDAQALVSAFMNLCVNAVEAMPHNGSLTLRTRNAPDGQVEVEIEDNGEGMTPAVLSRAMDPFFTTKETGKGTGLGLSMVYSTVKAHYGQIELRSAPGAGTCVRMTFPACPAEGAPVPPSATSTQPDQVGERLALLLVDDDDLITNATRTLIEVLGHEVVTASSGEGALLTLQGGYRPDAVILDMNMPGMGGAAVLPLLVQRCPGMPILLATGRADEVALRLVEAHAGVTLMPKPFSLEDLKAHLGRITGTPSTLP